MAISNTTLETYQADVLDVPGLVLVGFAAGGEVATVMEASLQAMVDRHPESVRAFRVDCAAQEQLLIDTGVNQLPMVLTYKNGSKVHALRDFPAPWAVERIVNSFI